MEQVKEAVSCGADVIMLDNMDIGEIGEAVRLIDRRALVEYPAGSPLRTLKRWPEAGRFHICRSSYALGSVFRYFF